MTTPDNNPDNSPDRTCLTVHGLPRQYWHCTWDNFRWHDVQPTSLAEHLVRFQKEVLDGHAPHLLLTGWPGIGKTHLGVALYRWAVAHYGLGRVQWIDVPSFCTAVKRGYGPGDVDPFIPYEELTKLVVLDDLFGRELSAHEKTQILPRLIEIPYQRSAAVVVTMNPDVATLMEGNPMEAHERSRLLANAVIIPMESRTDARRRRAP